MWGGVRAGSLGSGGGEKKRETQRGGRRRQGRAVGGGSGGEGEGERESTGERALPSAARPRAEGVSRARQLRVAPTGLPNVQLTPPLAAEKQAPMAGERPFAPSG